MILIQITGYINHISHEHCIQEHKQKAGHMPVEILQILENKKWRQRAQAKIKGNHS